MSILYDTINRLCKDHGITVGKMCTTIGLGKSVMSDLNCGRKDGLSTKTLSKIADFFEVTVDYLIAPERDHAKAEKNEKKPVAPKGDELVDSIIMSRDGKTVWRKYSKEQREALRVILDNMPYMEDEEL